MTNPFNLSLEETFRTSKCRVISRDDVEYTGFIDRIDWNQRHIIIHGAEAYGENVGSAMVSHAERIELQDQEREIKEVQLDQIKSSEYSAREFNIEDNVEYINDVHEHGSVKSFPVLIPTGEGQYTVIDGHKRIWAARNAGLNTQACEILDLDELEALKRFAWNHLPLQMHLDESNHEYEREERYSDMDTKISVMKMFKAHGEEILDIYPIKFNVERLGLSIGQQKKY